MSPSDQPRPDQTLPDVADEVRGRSAENQAERAADRTERQDERTADKAERTQNQAERKDERVEDRDERKEDAQDEKLSDADKQAIRDEAALTNSVPQFPDEVSEPAQTDLDESASESDQSQRQSRGQTQQ